MYSIGEFSKIGSVSTKTLRYYDEIDLLHPAYVDEDNHYRYYSENQVDEILFIAELKSLDLRLEQIKEVIKSNDKSVLNHFLEQRIKQLNEDITRNLLLQECIKTKMHEIQLGGVIMENKIVVEAKEFTPVYVMSKKATIEAKQISTVIGSAFEEIFKNGLKPSGPVMTFYLDEEFNPQNANVEVCIPVNINESQKEIEGIKLLNPGLCAFCRYVGAYSKLGKAYAAVIKWIEENNYHISSAPFDSYISNPQEVKNPDEFVTEVYFPISK